LASLERKEGRGKDGSRRDPRGCGGGPARQGEEEKERGRERLTSGARVSVRAKEKEKERGRGPVRGEGRWAAGPVGLKGEKGEVFSFFLFFFKLLLKPLFIFKFKSKLFQTFLKHL
jgi:hypothetical protein